MLYYLTHKLMSPGRLRSQAEHSSLLVAQCIRYALDNDASLEDVSDESGFLITGALTTRATKREQEESESDARPDISLQNLPMSQLLNSAVRIDLLLNILTFDERFCQIG